jgi:competence protein ComEA
MGYRQKADVELARLISDRLALVLAEQPPRRARGPGVVTFEEPAQLLPEVSTTDGALEPAAQHTGDIEELPPPRFGRLHAGVIGVLLVLGLITAGWLLLRARPVAVASPGEVVTIATPVPTAASTTPSLAKSASKIVVHVLGGVRRPGLVRLPESSRVQDAIDAAGGLTHQADPDELDLNRASQSQLEELPEIGPVTAQAILAWRQEHGRFTRIEELQEVDGIGPKTYAQLAPHVRV